MRSARFSKLPNHYDFEIAKRKVLDNNGNSITLTPCQDKALSEVFEWYGNTDDLFYTIVGGAGNGKSFLTDIIKRVIPMRNLVISAPTHKALRVSEKFTGIHGETVHKLLGLQPNLDLEDFDIHNPKFDTRNAPTIGNYGIIIFEESSMLSDDLFDYLTSEANANNTRILFIGDWYQLPPPANDYVKAYTEGRIAANPKTGRLEVLAKPFTHTSGLSILRTPARQSMEDPHYILLTALRSDIGRNEEDYNNLLAVADHMNEPTINACVQDASIIGSHFITILKRLPEFELENGNGYWLCDDKYEFVDEVVHAFNTPEFVENTNYCRFVAFQNDTISSWNKFIRDKLIDSKDPLIAGDLMMAYKTVYSPDMKPMIINSNEYIIKEVFEDMHSVVVRQAGVNNTLNFPYSYVEMADVFGKGELAKVNILREPFDNFKVAHEFFHAEGREKRRWKQYYNFKNRFLVRGKLEDKRWKMPKKDIDYAYGITAHKAQGSTFEYVFVNLNDLLEHSNISHYFLKKRKVYNPVTAQLINDVTLKLIYVALSRARQHASIYYSG